MFSVYFSPGYLYIIIDYKVNTENEHPRYSPLSEHSRSKPLLTYWPQYYRAKTGTSGAAVSTPLTPHGLL